MFLSCCFSLPISDLGPLFDSRFSLAQQITYSCVINVCKNAKRWREAKKLIAEMRECAIAPNEVCFANAIHACARAGEWTEALALLDVMRADPNVPDPNVVCYTAAIGACGKALEWQSILDVSSSRKVCKRVRKVRNKQFAKVREKFANVCELLR